MSTTYSNRKSFDLDWIERWARAVNDDRRLPVIGRFFNCRFLIGVDEREYLIEMQDGKIKRICEGLTPDNFGYEFGLKASASAWSKFCQEIPPPLFNDIWAMAHPLHKHMVIEGNTLPFWQNVRALTHMLALMRGV